MKAYMIVLIPVELRETKRPKTPKTESREDSNTKSHRFRYMPVVIPERRSTKVETGHEYDTSPSGPPTQRRSGEGRS